MDRAAGERREDRRADGTGSMDARWRPTQPASLVEVFLAQRRSSLRFREYGRSRPVHHAHLALVRGARSDPALAVLHTAAKKRTAVEQGGDLVVGNCDHRGADGIDRRADYVFAFAEKQHSVQGPEAPSSHSGIVFRNRGVHLGVQRDAFDGAVPAQFGQTTGGYPYCGRASRQASSVVAVCNEASTGGARSTGPGVPSEGT